MRSLISDSISSEPTLFKPSFNSSNVIVPLLSVSIILNNSRKPPISSSESPSAMTYKWLKIISNSNLHKQASCNFSIKPEKLDAKNYDIIGHGEVTDLIPWNQDLKCNFFFFFDRYEDLKYKWFPEIFSWVFIPLEVVQGCQSRKALFSFFLVIANRLEPAVGALVSWPSNMVHGYRQRKLQSHGFTTSCNTKDISKEQENLHITYWISYRF